MCAPFVRFCDYRKDTPDLPLTHSGSILQKQRYTILAYGVEFEIDFMQTMIKHHRQAIKEAETCLDKAYHPKLLSLCQNIIETQSAEIQQMQTWLCEWYGICKKNEMEG